jgi:hypothetical protein
MIMHGVGLGKSPLRLDEREGESNRSRGCLYCCRSGGGLDIEVGEKEMPNHDKLQLVDQVVLVGHCQSWQM